MDPNKGHPLGTWGEDEKKNEMRDKAKLKEQEEMALKSLIEKAKEYHHGQVHGTKDLKGDKALVGQYKTKTGKIKSPPKSAGSKKNMASDLIRYHMHHLGKHPGGPKQAIAIGLRQAGISKTEKAMQPLILDLSKGYMGFEAVKQSAARGGAKDPAAVAAAVGRKKYGAKEFQQMAAQGKKAPLYLKEKGGKSEAKKAMEALVAKAQEGETIPMPPLPPSAKQKGSLKPGQVVSMQSMFPKESKTDKLKEAQKAIAQCMDKAVGFDTKSEENVEKAITSRAMPRMPRSMARYRDTHQSGSMVLTRTNSKLHNPNGGFPLTPDPLAEVPEGVKKAAASETICKGCGRSYMEKGGGCPTCSCNKSTAHPEW